MDRAAAAEEMVPGPEPEHVVVTRATASVPPGTDLAAFVDEQARQRRGMLIGTWWMIARQHSEEEQAKKK